MSFYVVIEWNPAEEIPWEWRLHTSRPLATKRDAWRYVQRAVKRAELSDVQLHDVAVFSGKPTGDGVDVDHGKCRVYDHSLWRLHGRKTSYRAMFC